VDPKRVFSRSRAAKRISAQSKQTQKKYSNESWKKQHELKALLYKN
jgi:hypothetical protein